MLQILQYKAEIVKMILSKNIKLSVQQAKSNTIIEAFPTYYFISNMMWEWQLSSDKNRYERKNWFIETANKEYLMIFSSFSTYWG